MIFVIDDDVDMVRCITRYCVPAKVMSFANAVDAMAAFGELGLPELIFLDILLDGPDGFTFLNEMVSYVDTASVPVVVITSLDLEGRDLSGYGVVGILNKDTMTPQEVKNYVKKYAK